MQHDLVERAQRGDAGAFEALVHGAADGRPRANPVGRRLPDVLHARGRGSKSQPRDHWYRGRCRIGASRPISERDPPVNQFRLVLAIALLLIGLLWIGQGIGLVGKSAMSGQSVWAFIGVVLLIVAAGLAWSARRAARAGR